jgi:hypothetical protein
MGGGVILFAVTTGGSCVPLRSTMAEPQTGSSFRSLWRPCLSLDLPNVGLRVVSANDNLLQAFSQLLDGEMIWAARAYPDLLRQRNETDARFMSARREVLFLPIYFQHGFNHEG